MLTPVEVMYTVLRSTVVFYIHSARGQIMTSAWDDAAQKYKHASVGETSFDVAVSELEDFLETYGQSALNLLKVSNNIITFGHESSGDHIYTYLLTEEGLQRYEQVRSSTLGPIAHNQRSVRRFTNISVKTAVQAFTLLSNRKPVAIIPWLREQLDQIANKAPKI